MIFWIFAGTFTAGALALVLRPLLRRPGIDQTDTTDPAAAYDIAVYKSQLREIERELRHNRITEEEAESSRLEISRRLLIADQRAVHAETNLRKADSSAASLFACFVLAASMTVSFVLYGWLGDPANPDVPLALRQAEIQLTELAQEGALADTGRNNQGLDDQIIALRNRLMAEGGASEEWAQLGRAEMVRGAFAEAARAYETAVSLTPENAELNAAYGEALVFWANGEVTPQAYITFQRVLALDPGNPRARFYSGDYQRQEGQYKKALDIWVRLLATGDASAPWRPLVIERATHLAEEMGLDITSEIEAAQQAESEIASAPETMRGPTPEDIQAAQDLSPEDQLAMIEGMVGRLAERLEQEPENLEGWMRLGQSYVTLGKDQDALAAYERASRLAPKDAGLIVTRARLMRALAGDRPTPETVQLMIDVTELDPNNIEALWFLGLNAVERMDVERAGLYFNQALSVLPENSPEHETLSKEIEKILTQINH